MGAVGKELEYKQKRDNRKSTVAGVYKLGCVWVGINTIKQGTTAVELFAQ